ncbi:Hydroxyacid-oxoacid transhydrogenase, mitochondrial [Rhizophlyctis rosea]|uniref:Hydroxyacid-oxoacid transhydrogenase, mitochondrial n=1 Tax=Rhizophlyctis rosea TaxID=64517 RepID=A0AAD5SFA3_9FUNG|nr:Hydroxyacid-oxoacid transhydrogenase, mitochondrial [Rhizophlyctis rosea]
MPPFTRTRVWSVMSEVATAANACPCHAPAPLRVPTSTAACAHHGQTRHATIKDNDTDYAFEMAASNIRYGNGVTREIGHDLKHLKAQKVAIFTDKKIATLPPSQTVLKSLESLKIPYVLYDRVRVEPTDKSFQDAIQFSKQHNPDAFVAVGGGSVIDTAKAANLYLCHPDAEFLDFVNAPIGKGRNVTNSVKPLIAVPTTAGTGSETTGVAIFDYTPQSFKTGIANRVLKPTLGIIDPQNTATMPPQVHVSSGLDVLCHALESYTALPYTHRAPRPATPQDRPAYQGSNPISDIWSLKALKMCVQNLPRVWKSGGADERAREEMVLAATYAGVGFGNAALLSAPLLETGVHLCHGMSYPIAGLNKGYRHVGYDVGHDIVPHGISVALTAPAVFKFTAPACPERHLEAAALFGVDTSRANPADAGLILSDALRKFLRDLDVPDGLEAVGYGRSDLGRLVEGTLPQHRVTKLSPKTAGREVLEELFEGSLRIY